MGLRHRLTAAVSSYSRTAKLDYLAERIPLGSSVLLIGVSRYTRGPSDNIIERGLTEGRRAVGLMYEEIHEGQLPLRCPIVRGDTLSLPFADKSFDFVMSNAVIEHVGGPEQARRMIGEGERVARVGAFHTTPDRAFPIETHTQVPLLHWLPRRFQTAAFAKVGRDLPLTGTWLFTRRTFRQVTGSHYRVTRRPMTLIAERSL